MLVIVIAAASLMPGASAASSDGCTVTIIAGDGGSVSDTSVSVEPGTSYEVSGNVLVIDGLAPIVAEADLGHSFASWSVSSGTVEGDMEITAEFEQDGTSVLLLMAALAVVALALLIGLAFSARRRSPLKRSQVPVLHDAPVEPGDDLRRVRAAFGDDPLGLRLEDGLHPRVYDRSPAARRQRGRCHGVVDGGDVLVVAHALRLRDAPDQVGGPGSVL